MRIGELSSQAHVSIQTLRYYERRGLLPAPDRQTSGYRRYPPDAVQRVRFIRRAQELGFTLQEIDDLLALWADSTESCGAVEKRASSTLERIEEKINGLMQMREALNQYVNACRQRHSLATCPLLAALGEELEKKA